jgi:hypothetical protein
MTLHEQPRLFLRCLLTNLLTAFFILYSVPSIYICSLFSVITCLVTMDPLEDSL